MERSFAHYNLPDGDSRRGGFKELQAPMIEQNGH
jgi:hypothetical protein